jgi:hypothetical protein
MSSAVRVAPATLASISSMTPTPMSRRCGRSSGSSSRTTSPPIAHRWDIAPTRPRYETSASPRPTWRASTARGRPAPRTCTARTTPPSSFSPPSGYDVPRNHEGVALIGESEVHSPNVAGHVEQAVAVRREAPHGGRALVAVQPQVLPRKLALPGVRHRAAVGEMLVAPGKRGTLEPATRRELPLDLRGQLLAEPAGVGLDILAARCTTGWPSRRSSSCPGPRDGSSRRPAGTPASCDSRRGSPDRRSCGRRASPARAGQDRRPDTDPRRGGAPRPSRSRSRARSAETPPL